MTTLRIRSLAVLGLLTLFAAACGGGGGDAAEDEPADAATDAGADAATDAAEEAADPGTDAAEEAGDDATAGTDGDAASVPDNPDEGVTTDEILLGWMGDATGPTASAQAFNLAGSQAAVQYFNEQGGVVGRDLVLLDRDDQFVAETAITNYAGLVNDERVLALIQLGGAHISEALMPTVAEDQIPVIGPPQTIDAQLENDYVFNNIAHYSDEADVAVQFMVDETGVPEDLVVAVIQLELPSGDEWNTYIQNRLPDVGATYTDRLLLNPASPDYAGTVQRLSGLIDEQGVNFAAMHAAPAQALGVVTEMERLGVNVPLVGIHGLAAVTIYEEGPAVAADLVHGVSSFLPATSDCEMCAVMADFVAGTGFEEPSHEVNFGHGWLDVMIAVQAIERAAESGELSRASLHEALQGDFETGGISCPISWSESNHSPCAAPYEWLGDRIDTIETFDAWSEALQGEYGLFQAGG